MKFYKFKFILSFAAMVVVLWSCKDNTTNPPASTKNYYPMTVGNYWVYQDYETDSLGNIIQNKMSIDSTYISGQTTKLGKQAYVFVTTTNDTAPSENYFYKDAAKLYTFSNFINSDATSNFFNISDRWVLLADDNGSQWTVFDTTVTNLPLDFGGNTVNMSGRLTFSGQKGGMTTVIWGKNKDKSLQAQEFITNVKFTGTVTVLVPFNITMTSAIHTYYADNIGPVKTKMDPFKISTDLPIGSQTMGGYETFMINYNVK